MEGGKTEPTVNSSATGGWASKFKGLPTGMTFSMGGGDGRRGSGGLPSSQPHTEGGHVEERDSDANEKKAGTANVVANMTSAASAAGKITSSKLSGFKAAVASLDKYMEASLFEAGSTPNSSGEVASPLRQAPISIGVRKSVANDPGTAPSGAGAATGTGMKPSTSVTSLISMAAVGTTSVLKQLAGGSYHEDDDAQVEENHMGEDPEDEGAVGWTVKAKKAPASPAGLSNSVNQQKKAALVWSPQKEKAAAALLKQLELVQGGGMLTLLHRNHGQPLMALSDTAMQASVFVSWSRLLIDDSYWTAEDGFLSPNPPSLLSLDHYTVDTVELPALKDSSFYRPTSDDAACFIVVEMETRGGTVSQRLLAGPIELEAGVKKAIRAVVDKPSLTADKGATLHVAKVGGTHQHSGFSDIGLWPEVEVEVTGTALRIESVNADTPRGFNITLEANMQVKGSPLHPTCLQLLVPPRDGAIKYYGDRSGELATFINQTIPAVKHKHSASDVDDEAEEFMEGTPVSAGPERVALTIRLPSILAREVLMAYLKLALSEVQKDARKGPTQSREARLGWAVWDAAMSLRAEAAAQETERARLVLVREAEQAKAQCSDLASRLNGKEAELTKAKDALVATQAQLEQARVEKDAMAAELKATAEQVAALRLEAKQAMDESAAAATLAKAKVEETERASQEELTRLRNEVASYKKKSDSLAKELKVAIAGGGGATAGADKAKVHELEKKLENAQKENEAYKQALERTLQSIGRT